MVSHSAAKIDATAKRSPKISVGGWARIVSRLLLLVLCLTLFVPLHYATHLAGLRSHWPKRFLGSAAAIVGARVRTTGLPLARGVFFISNHVSWIDILALGGASGTAFIAKAELGDTPVLNWLCSLNRTLYVSRENKVSRDNKLGVTDQIAMLRAAMAENHAIAVFPEGTTTDGQSLLPFKSSLLAVLEPPPSDIEVQPVCIDYADVATEIAWIGEESGLDNALRLLARRGSFDLTLHFLDPFEPTAALGRKGIAARSRSSIEARLSQTLGRSLVPFTVHSAP